MADGGYFEVRCCKKQRGRLPSGVLICPVCDFAHDHASTIPNENLIKDMPLGQRYVYNEELRGE